MTTYTAIHVAPNGQVLTAEFTTKNSERARSVISGRSTDILRSYADAAMKQKHGVRAMGWSEDNAEDVMCPWYGLYEAKDLDIPLPQPEPVTVAS